MPRRPRDPLTAVSKRMSYFLRHAANKVHLNVGADGYALVSDVLALIPGATEEQLREVVAGNDKKRFSLCVRDGKEYVRANQGHSLKHIRPDLLLTPIVDASEISVVVHGTTRKAWPLIAASGLSKMTRNHIHFAAGLPSDGVISGMRTTAQVAIYVDAAAAMAAGIKFYRSDNGVILSEGIGGVLPPRFFSRVYDRHLRRDIPLPGSGEPAAGAPVPPTPPAAVAAGAPAPAPAATAGASAAPPCAGAGAAAPSVPSNTRRRRGRGGGIVQHVGRQGSALAPAPVPRRAGAAAGAGAGGGAGTGAASGTPGASAAGAVKRCAFRYLVVLDFEATCEANRRIPNQEVIEFPSVVYDTHRQRVVDEYQECVALVAAVCPSHTNRGTIAIVQLREAKGQPQAVQVLYRADRHHAGRGGCG